MQPSLIHEWDITPTEARRLQRMLASRVIKDNDFKTIKYIAGTDVANEKGSDNLIAAITVLCADTLEIVEIATFQEVAQFPYIPGLFSFRETPPLIKAFSKLNTIPDLVICDGHGIAHPRRFGIASHLGLIMNIPTIGCGKKKLIGEGDPPDLARGSTSALIDDNEVIGSVLRTQNNIKPVYISIGHRISLATACEWILRISPRYRLPETTRPADQAVNKTLKELYPT